MLHVAQPHNEGKPSDFATLLVSNHRRDVIDPVSITSDRRRVESARLKEQSKITTVRCYRASVVGRPSPSACVIRCAATAVEARLTGCFLLAEMGHVGIAECRSQIHHDAHYKTLIMRNSH